MAEPLFTDLLDEYMLAFQIQRYAPRVLIERETRLGQIKEKINAYMEKRNG